jgi:hypothetical protein
MAAPRRLLPLALPLLLGACSGARLTAAEAAARGLCPSVVRQSAPLIVEWSAADRGQLEALRAQHVVAARSTGCELEVLPRCEVPAHYAYVPITPKHEHVAVHDEDELFANLPLHAAALSAKLKSAGELDVDMTTVGRFEADRPEVRPDELRGECAGATHVIFGISAGAFSFFSGSDRRAGAGVETSGAGAGGHVVEKREVLSQDGNAGACAAAAAGDKAPPFGCGALTRIELVPVGGISHGGAPSCSTTTTWDGHQCIRVDPGGCPPRTVFAQGACFPEDGKSCPEGYHLDDARGCVREGGTFVAGPCPPRTHREGGGCVADAAAPGTMARIPGGNFMMGSHCTQPFFNCQPAHSVNVAPFEIDLTEVTVAAFKSCVDSGRCLVPPSDGRCNWGKDGHERHPINCVDWEQARTYCAMVGKRLPTEAEWEFAAVGQTGWIYPWGNEEPDKTRSCPGNVEWGETCDVGLYPAGKSHYGVLDMVGNVKEWTADAWCSYDTPPGCVAEARAVRNGVPASRREPLDHTQKDASHGFRCARSL